MTESSRTSDSMSSTSSCDNDRTPDPKLEDAFSDENPDHNLGIDRCCNVRKDTPLIMAAIDGGLDGVSELLDAGASVDMTNCYGRTALMEAAKAGRQDIVQLLAQSGSDVNQGSIYGTRPLMYAAMKGHLAVVETLIRHGSEVNAADSNGWTPLMYAAYEGQLDVVKLLCYKGADVNIADNVRQTALMCAAEQGHGEIVQHLQEHECDINAVSATGRTALHFGAQYGKKDVVQILIKSGASLNKEGYLGETPLTLAKQGGHKEIVAMLRKAEAKQKTNGASSPWFSFTSKISFGFTANDGCKDEHEREGNHKRCDGETARDIQNGCASCTAHKETNNQTTTAITASAIPAKKPSPSSVSLSSSSPLRTAAANCSADVETLVEPIERAVRGCLKQYRTQHSSETLSQKSSTDVFGSIQNGHIYVTVNVYNNVVIEKSQNVVVGDNGSISYKGCGMALEDTDTDDDDDDDEDDDDSEDNDDDDNKKGNGHVDEKRDNDDKDVEK